MAARKKTPAAAGAAAVVPAPAAVASVPAGLLDRSAILAAPDLAHEDVPVPEWGGVVRIAAFSAAARDSFELWVVQSRQKGSFVNVRAALVARCAVDAEGRRLFSDSEVEALGAKSAAALDRLFEVAGRLNRVTEGDIEDLEKN